MIESTKVTMSVGRRKAITAHVKVIMTYCGNEFNKAIDKREAFSNYVIAHHLRRKRRCEFV